MSYRSIAYVRGDTLPLWQAATHGSEMVWRLHSFGDDPLSREASRRFMASAK